MTEKLNLVEGLVTRHMFQVVHEPKRHLEDISERNRQRNRYNEGNVQALFVLIGFGEDVALRSAVGRWDS